MKHITGLMVLVSVALVAVCSIGASVDADGPHTFNDGVLVYEVVDATGHEVKVTDIVNKTDQNLNIPATVTDGGIEYKVVSLAGLDAEETRLVRTLSISENVRELTDAPKPEDTLPGMFRSLETVTVSAQNTVFKVVDNVLFKGIVLYLYPSASSATSYTIPATVTDIVRGSFAYAENLKEFKVEAGNTAFKAGPDGALYDADSTTLYAYPCGKDVDIPEFPSTVDRLEMYSFAGSRVVAVTIPDGVNDFGNYVFADCLNLDSVVLGKSVNKIDAGFFKGCSSLEDIFICGDFASIEVEPYAFVGCDDDIEFESGRDGKDLKVFTDAACTMEFDFAPNSTDITLYLQWSDEQRSNIPLIFGLVVVIVLIGALAVLIYKRRTA